MKWKIFSIIILIPLYYKSPMITKMNYYTKENLHAACKNLTEVVVLKHSSGGSAYISKYGGRLLGLFPKSDEINLLWVNPNLKEIVKSNQRAIGGDRYWISPERDFFYKDPLTWSDWFCPPGLDPGNYEILGYDSSSCTLSSAVSLTNQRTKQILTGQITRQISLLEEPISTSIKNYCGVEFIDDCVFFQSGQKINSWSLACVISGGVSNPGTVLIPTKTNPKPLSYYRNIPSERLKVGDNYIAFKIDVNDIYKLAVRPEDINFDRKCKIAYILKLPGSEQYALLMKLSDDVPKTQEQCFDIARDHPDGGIGVIQSYNSESPEIPILKYGEIELQLNMFKTIDNTSHGKALHQLIGYIGEKQEILEALELYTSIREPILFD
jgi:hypothetical protein